MCDPMTLTGLALSAGSSVMNNMAANDAAKARSSALNAERLRQRGMEQKQTALADESQGQLQNFGEDQGQRVSDLAGYFKEPIASDANAEAGMIAPEGTSSITVREMANQSGKATDKANASAENLASLRSFGDLLGDKMRGVQRNSGAIDQMTGMRRGSTDALSFELDAAAQKGAGKRMFADLLGGAGSLVGGYSAMAGAGNPVVTNAMGRLGGGDRLADALRRAGAPATNVRSGLLG